MPSRFFFLKCLCFLLLFHASEAGMGHAADQHGRQVISVQMQAPHTGSMPCSGAVQVRSAVEMRPGIDAQVKG